MWIVALNAHTLFERFVLVRAARLEVVAHMTLCAKVADGAVLKRKGFFHIRGVMTRVATRRYDRIVRARPHEFWLIRGVRIVADHAGFCLNGIVAVRRFKGCFAAIMAGQAERQFHLDQQVLLVRAVRKMACRAPRCLNYFVHVFLFKGFFFVALIADFLSFCLEQMVPRSGVRIVASRAFACFEGGMQVRLVRADLFPRVTIIAESVPVLFQAEFRNNAVPQMTDLAVPVLYHGVHIFHLEVRVGKFCMAAQTFLAGQFFLRCRRG